MNTIKSDAIASLQPGFFEASGDQLLSDEGGKPVSTIGVEVHPIGSAPFGELVWVYVYGKDLDAAGLHAFAAEFCGHQPLIVGPMQFVAILEHGPKLGECFGAVPGDANGLNLHEVAP